GVEKALRGLARCEVHAGHARFTSAREIAVGDHRLTAERIFIDVGGRALVPSMPGLDRGPFPTDRSMQARTSAPPHPLIVGGSYVGLEFGQMFRRFGSEVTIIEMASRLVQREDPEVSSAIGDVLVKEGINVRLNARCLRVGRNGNSIVAHVD